MSVMLRPVCALDHFVRVEIFEVQLLGDEPAHGRLARAHEADERDVDEVAVAVAWRLAVAVSSGNPACNSNFKRRRCDNFAARQFAIVLKLAA